MDYQDLRTKSVEFMLDRGWKEKTAKKGQFEQSLFDHTIIEMDALITLLPLLRQSFVPPFTEQEEQVMLMGILLHDIGKELDEWQEYVLGRREYISHVNRELAEKVVYELATKFGFSGIEEILSAVVLHMRNERSQAKVINRLLFGEHINPRWKTLADLVDAVDNLCSIKGLLASLYYLSGKSGLSNHLLVTYHLVQMRGVSTILLHRAAIEAFTAQGWDPLLHYSNGTIYAASSTEKMQEPPLSEVETELAKMISNAMGSKFAELIVGNPLQSMIPKPDLFDYCELKEYLKVASQRVKRKKASTIDSKTIDSYFKEKEIEPVTEESDRQIYAERLGLARPEMCIFKFFKAALSSDLTGDEVTTECAEAYADFAEGGGKKKKPKVTPQSILRAEYDSIFGNGAYDQLQSTSTLQPAKDMALAVDRFWELEGTKFGLGSMKVEYLEDAKREETLIDTLVKIADKVYSAIPEAKRPTRATSDEIAKHFLTDMIHPTSESSFEELITQQLTAYGNTKTNARKEKGLHLCPICNQTFDGGSEAKADFIGNPESHTNRATSHSGGGRIVICDACKFERFLQQILLGSKVTDMLVLFPRMNIGHSSGEILRQKAIKIWDSASFRMSENNPEPDLRISMGLTYNIARKISDYDVYRLTTDEIIGLITYESSDNKKKEHRKELEKELKDLYGLDKLTVEYLNENWGTNFTSVDEALEALISGKVSDDEASKIRAKIFRLSPEFYIACQTPHMILIPLTSPITMGDESDTNAGIRELYVTLILGLALDCSVAVMKVGEVIAFEGGEGVARVPPVPALRDLVGSEWVAIKDAKRWLDAIGAAALLTSSAEFPERSNLYQILKSPTLGHILRRIEHKNESGQASIYHFQLLDKLKGVIR
jgi:hypothetical protein